MVGLAYRVKEKDLDVFINVSMTFWISILIQFLQVGCFFLKVVRNGTLQLECLVHGLRFCFRLTPNVRTYVDALDIFTYAHKSVLLVCSYR